jgi:cyclic beta-1,2-glucan synthetase
MYRVGIESLLGLTLKHGALHIEPCVPRHWPRYEVRLRTDHGEFHIVVENPDGVNRGVRSVELDGAPFQGDIPLPDLTGSHQVRVVLGGGGYGAGGGHGITRSRGGTEPHAGDRASRDMDRATS